jgi:hypothetical protein
MIRHVYATVLRVILMTPLFVVSFIGGIAEEINGVLDRVLPWVRKETAEERKRRLLGW